MLICDLCKKSKGDLLKELKGKDPQPMTVGRCKLSLIQENSELEGVIISLDLCGLCRRKIRSAVNTVVLKELESKEC